MSQQIKSLELELGVELFKRVARGVEFTPLGEQYYIEVRRSFDLLDDATRRIRRTEKETEITISVENSLALHWLVPRLPAFHALNPRIAVTVASRPLPRTEATRYSDIAIAYGRRSYAGLMVDELMTEHIVPVCSPDLLEQVGPFDGPDWVGRVRLIHDRTFADEGLLPNWQGWLETVGYPDVPAEAGISFASSSLCLAYAAAGGGVALARSRIAGQLISEGKLINPVGTTTLSPSPYFLVGSPVLIDTPSVRQFVDWLHEMAESDESESPAVANRTITP